MNTEDLKKFNCRYVDTFEYCDKKYIMGVQILENGINYRYFEANENISEVTDKKLLEEFRKNHETHSDVEFL